MAYPIQNAENFIFEEDTEEQYLIEFDQEELPYSIQYIYPARKPELDDDLIEQELEADPLASNAELTEPENQSEPHRLNKIIIRFEYNQLSVKGNKTCSMRCEILFTS